jgi:hypothetical protein
METRKENYLLDVTIIAEDESIPNVRNTIPNVRCKVYLPERLTDPVRLTFHFDKEMARLFQWLNLWKFSIEGERNPEPGFRTKISAKNVYSMDMTITHWSPELAEAVLVAEPTDLKIEHFRPGEDSQVSSKSHGRFWLTPNKLLTPAQILNHSYTGDVKIETVWHLEFTLQNGLPISFVNRYHHKKNANGEYVSFADLVADFKKEGEPNNSAIADESLQPLDVFLRLASLAARQRSACLGYDILSTSGYSVKLFRRNVSIPVLRKDQDDVLIDQQHFESFLKTAYDSLLQLDSAGLIKQAIDYALPRERDTVESSFLALYSALETLVLYFRKGHRLETVFAADEEEQWKGLERDLRQWLKNHSLLTDKKDKRKLLYENLPALKRVSFSTAFIKCRDSYGVKLDDLWPVLGSSEGWSLSTIRNKLVHGEHFAQRLGALGTAKEHLRWTVERFLLTILNWTVSESNVSADYLTNHSTAYKSWTEDCRIISS